MEYKFGYVAIIGKPNAGKSTLINNLIKEKVSIVSDKPQTTRNNILGILNGEDYQVVFVDTPGIHATRTGLDKFMMKRVRSASDDVSLIIYILDGTKKLGEEEKQYLKTLVQKEIKVIIAVNKIDVSKYENVYPLLSELSTLGNFVDIVPVSALSGKNVDVILSSVLKNLDIFSSKEVFDFPTDYYTDKSVRFLISEIVREKALELLQEEIPHGIAVVISSFEENEKIAKIEATIYCEKDSHKNIIIGKNGLMSKQIGTMARLDTEKLLNKKVMLKIWVRVKKDWRNNLNSLSEIGYNENS